MNSESPNSGTRGLERISFPSVDFEESTLFMAAIVKMGLRMIAVCEAENRMTRAVEGSADVVELFAGVALSVATEELWLSVDLGRMLLSEGIIWMIETLTADFAFVVRPFCDSDSEARVVAVALPALDELRAIAFPAKRTEEEDLNFTEAINQARKVGRLLHLARTGGPWFPQLALEQGN